MVRKRTSWHIAFVFALAVGIGAVSAFLKPASKRPVERPAAASAPVTIAPDNTFLSPTAATAGPATKPVSTFKQRPSKMPEAPVFVERANGVYEASTAHYTALLSAEGLRYMPKSADGTASELQLKLNTVRRGEFSVFERATDPEADTELAVAKNGGLSYWRTPAFEECYEPHGNGIEQTFVLDAAPIGEGALEFSFDVSVTGLTPLPARANRHGGILFADASGKIGARYGQVMVRDAANRALVVEPALDVAAGKISFSVSAEWLDNAQYPVVVDPLVGSDFAVSDSSINQVGVEQPTVCAGNNNWLVAWNDFTAGASLPQLAGAIVSPNGTVSNTFAISSPTGLPLSWRFQRIEAAFDGANWLVVWSDDRQTGPGVRGAIVASDGAVLGGTDFLIASTTGQVLEDPLVTYNGTTFVVAWSDTPPALSGGSQIHFSLVSSSGVVGATQVVKASASPINQALEYLTSQRPSGDILIIYQELSEIPALHRSTRIQPNGLVRDPGGTALFREDHVQTDGGQGFGRPIGAVFNAGEWQILSSLGEFEDSSVYLHHLSLDGNVTPPTGVFAEVGLGPTGFEGSLSGFTESFAPAFPGATDWLFLRTERISNTVYHIIGKRIGFDGTDKDPIPFQVDTSTRGVTRNAVASQSGSTFLVAWLDGRSSPAQPGDRRNIAAAMIDATATSPADTALIAVATASPTSGEAGVTVSFDSVNSKGSYDALSWDFGDGTTSTLLQPSHTYKNNGTYVAQLKVTKGAYSVFDTVVITVGTGGSTGDATELGIPRDNTPPIVSGMFINSAIVKLDFFNLSNDKATITGIFDITSLPNALSGLIPVVQLGEKSFQLKALDTKGQSKSDAGESPAYAFAIDQVKGTFTFQLGAANIRAEMINLGMINDNVKTNTVTITLPVTISIDKLKGTTSVGCNYVARKNVVGTATYAFLSAGDEISGAFLVTSVTCTEANGNHTYMIKGRLIKPGVIKPAIVDSAIKIFLGNYQSSIDGGSIANKKGILTYMAPKTFRSGIKKFTLSVNNGAFTLQMIQIPSDIAAGGTGLPLAKSGTNIVKVNMNLSFQLELENNERMTAGRFMYIGRTNAATRSWKLR